MNVKATVNILLIGLALLAPACESSDLPASSVAPESPTVTTPVDTTATQPRPAMTNDAVTFSINVQDFGHPAESAATLNRIIDLHEQYDVPVDIYLTGQMAEIYATQFPDLLDRLKTSPVVAISYHVRPPAPYYNNYDWLGLAQLSPDQQYEIIKRYETHATDLVTGQTTAAPGGYARVSELIGYPPWSAGALADANLEKQVMRVFKEMGARFTISHGRVNNLGDEKDGLFIKPEQSDYKLYEHAGQDAAQSFEEALAVAHTTKGAQAPYIVGVKMHDNNFFAAESAWTTVYMAGGKRPNWDPTLTSPLISQAEQDAMWAFYEQTVIHVASQKTRITAVNLPMILDLLK